MAKTNSWGGLAAAAGTLVAVGLVLLIMLVVVEAGPAEATFPGNPGKIAYSHHDAVQDYEIYTIKPDGGVGWHSPPTIRAMMGLATRLVARR
jgi:hypothetical protein